MAGALARRLNLPLKTWQADVEPRGLVVAWSLEHVAIPEFWIALREYTPSTRLFVHASCWTDPFDYAPDFTTVLYQQITNAWEGGLLRVDPDTQELNSAPPDPRSVEELVAEVMTAEPENTPIAADLQQQIARLMHYPQSGPRPRQRAGGPVPSNHF